MKRVFLSFWLLLTLSMVAVVFNSCGKDDDIDIPPQTTNANHDEGMIINGVKWATRNLNGPEKFASKPETSGMFYQWNRKTSWAITGDVTDWNISTPEGTKWEKANDPSLTGWRIPTLDEFKTLLDTTKVRSEWTTENEVNGRRFTDKATGNSIFLPATGFREYSVGMLSGVGFRGCYWSSTQSNAESACLLNFDSDKAEWSGLYYRKNGFNIRCVADDK